MPSGSREMEEVARKEFRRPPSQISDRQRQLRYLPPTQVDSNLALKHVPSAPCKCVCGSPTFYRSDSVTESCELNSDALAKIQSSTLLKFALYAP